MAQSPRPKVVSKVLIAAGVIILLAVAGYYGWQQWQGRQVREQLLAIPTELQVAKASASATPAQEPTTALPTAAPTVSVATTAPTETSRPAPSPTTAVTAIPSPTATPPTKPARLQIPDLKIDVPVSDMGWKVVNSSTGVQSEWEIPEYAAGRAINSALLGERGNLVISGHNNIFGRVFMKISQAWPEAGLKKVDSFTDQADILNGRKVQLVGEDGRQFQYVITAFYRLKDSGVPQEQRVANAKFMDPTDDQRVTIITCWPPWSNTHRLVIVAQPVT